MKTAIATASFLAKYPGWHSIAKGRAIRNSVKSLEKRGFAEVVRWPSGCWQARHTGKVIA